MDKNPLRLDTHGFTKRNLLYHGYWQYKSQHFFFTIFKETDCSSGLVGILSFIDIYSGVNKCLKVDDSVDTSETTSQDKKKTDWRLCTNFRWSVDFRL